MGVWPDKDPDDILDYGLDLSSLIGDAADVISTTDATVMSGDIVVSQHSASANQRTVTWLSGGTGGSTSMVRIRTSTQLGRRVDVTMQIKMADH